jgi:zinc protease
MRDFKGGDAVAAGENFDVSPENIDKRTTIANLSGPTGIRVVLLPKATRGGKVIAFIELRFGDEKTLFGKDVVGDMTAGMLSRGTERMTREQLAAAFEKLQTVWDVGGNSQGIVMRVETTKANLEPSLALAREVLRTPRFDPAEFEQLRTGAISGIEAARSEPGSILSQRMERHGNPYPKGDVRYAMTFDEELTDLRAMKIDDVRAFYRDFYGASQAVVSVVGDFDPATVTSQLQTTLGDWRSATAYTRVPEPALDLPPAQFRIEVKDKQNAVASGKLEFPLLESDRDFQALRLAMQIFGSQGNGRLWNRIREKEGLSYGVSASVSGGLFNANADFSFGAIAAPQNMDRVKAAFEDELARARSDGFTADELKRAKDAIKAASRLGRAQDATLGRTLMSFAERGKTPLYFAELESMRNQMSLDEVNAAFRKYIVPEKLVYGVAGDFANAKGAVAKLPVGK